MIFALCIIDHHFQDLGCLRNFKISNDQGSSSLDDQGSSAFRILDNRRSLALDDRGLSWDDQGSLYLGFLVITDVINLDGKCMPCP